MIMIRILYTTCRFERLKIKSAALFPSINKKEFMKPESIMHSDLLDILFEGRNKSYGAYALRKEYPKQLMKSLLVIVLFIVALLFIQYFAGDATNKNSGVILPNPDVPVIKFVDLPIQHTPPPPKKLPALRPPTATVPNAPPIIVDDPPKLKMPTIDQLDKSNIGDSTVEGPPAPFNSSPTPVATGDNGNGKGDEKNNTNVQPEIVSAPDVAPAFPGGTDGWVRFLKKNLRPKESDEAYKVKVIVNFIVNEDGTLSELRIIQSGGAEFDNEVLRVMRKSPKWNPGIYHGHQVKVYHSQPVIFMNQADE
jgi:protein TonB